MHTKPFKSGDMSDMAHRIKTQFVDPERRDYDQTELEMISNGDRPGAKIRWHKRTGR